MTIVQIISEQLLDPFRIVLICGLVYTMQRTRAATGVWIPLAAGILFIAFLIPSTLAKTTDTSFFTQLWTGAVANVFLTAVVLALFEIYKGLRSK